MTSLTRRGLAAAAATLALPGLARAQAPWPSRPIRWVVPYAPGGGSDFLARTLAAAISGPLGQSVAVDNRPGGATIPATESVARAAPDGYTVLSADLTALVINPAMARRLPYDPFKDFAFVATTARFPFVLVVHPSVQATTGPELVELARRNPGRINFGSPGAGSPSHLATERFARRTGTQVEHVAYRGGAPAVQDLVAGQVQAMFIDYASGAGPIAAGQVRAIATPAPQRLSLLPNVPTLAEQGLTGADIYSWQGLVAPAGTPEAAQRRIEAEMQRALRTEEVAARLRGISLDPFPGTGAELKALAEAETAIWAPLIRELGLTLDS
ncbi:Bug family tripartite tricarboxylate transporter substrate binding protein [Falsiroseomonas sp. HW251]|uniref:Bug family tripartite tricarboxylate transporter substrate binding protein n=1 Tax=Falsiroseomonas sp. HW251 TaxID=3390998 RepID=UPI003D31DA37